MTDLTLTPPAEPRALTPKEEQNTWQYKAIVATRGNQTLIGTLCIYLAGRQAKGRCLLGPICIDEEGLAWAPNFRNQRGEVGMVCLGWITDIRDDFRRLSNHLKLDDVERIELFDELRKMIDVDLRSDDKKGPQFH